MSLRILALLCLCTPLAVFAGPITTPNGQPVTPVPVVDTPPCTSDDHPDTPARAFKDADGNVQLLATSNINRRLIGPSLSKLKRDCTVLFQGKANPDPAHHNGRGWLHGFYTEDGKTIYALVHNEFWGHRYFKECKGNYQKCWWNDITWAVSKDGGNSYQQPDASERLVIGFAQPYKPNIGKPAGFMNPTNILENDGYLYAIVHSMSYENQEDGNYLIRKKVSAPWSEWEVHSRWGFESVKERIAKGGPVGTPLNLGQTSSNFSDTSPMKAYNLLRHIPSGKFVVLLTSKQPAQGQGDKDGFYISTSTDLITWSTPVQILRANLRPEVDCKANPQAGPVEYYRYASLIDPESTDRNFSTTGNTPYLFTSRLVGAACKGKKEQTLLRMPVELDIK